MAKELSVLREYAETNGGLTEVAKSLGVSKGLLWAWISRGQVPIDQCLFVSEKTGIGRAELRPDDWDLIWPELAEKYPERLPTENAA